MPESLGRRIPVASARGVRQFRHAHLSNANLSFADLHWSNFLGGDLSNANLNHADLLGANFEGAILVGANLKGTILIAANVSDNTLSQALLCKTVLPEGSGLDPNRDCGELGVEAD